MINKNRDVGLIPPRAPVEIAPVHVPMAPVPLAAPPVLAQPHSGGLLDYVSIFRRNVRLILGAALAAALLGYVSTIPLKPIYRARTTIEVQAPNENFMNVGELDPSAAGGNSADTYVETQARILQDDAALERTAARLRVPYRPEVLASPTRFGEWKAHMFPGRSARPAALTRDETLGRLRANLTVNATPQSHLVEIQYDSVNPEFAAEFANALANELIDQNLDARWNAAQKTAEWLAGPMAELKRNLEASAAALQNYAATAGLILNNNDGSTAAGDKLRQVQEELSRVQADRALKQSRYEIAAAAPPDSLPEVIDDAGLRDARNKVNELKREDAELSATFTPAYFKLKTVRAQMAEMESIARQQRTVVLGRIRNEYDEARVRENLVRANYEEQAKLVSDQAAKAVHYETLKRELDSNRTLYETMLQKVKEAGIVSAIRASNIRVISQARPPASPVKPAPLFNTAAGLFAGLFLSAAFVLIKDQTDHTIRMPGDAALHLNVVELGAIPSRKLERRLLPHKRLITLRKENARGGEAWQWFQREPVGVADWGEFGSLLAESFRSTLASLWFAGKRGKRLRVFGVSSPSAHEGKTTLTVNLGVALANTNRRVLLIDGDLRRPQVHRIFGLENDRGLADVLGEDRPIEDYAFEELFRETAVEGLYVLPGGHGAANVASMRFHDRLADLVMRARLEFHAALIDTPPALELADARILGGLTDGVILVLRSGRTSREVAAATLRRFQEDGIAVLGAVLNDWNPRHAPYGYGSAYASGRYTSEEKFGHTG
ncbi:MAG: GNVR domain-containing protein [Bryobacteraceae bacterium]